MDLHKVDEELIEIFVPPFAAHQLSCAPACYFFSGATCRMMRALLLLVAVAFATSPTAETSSVLRRTQLSTWHFASLNGSIALSNVSTPGTCHTHLLDAGVLHDDPYRRFHELDMAWVARTTWVYETSLPTAMGANARAVFTSLDGVAHVSLNGKSLGLPAVNAFRPHVFPLPKRLVRADANNTLRVVFTPPLEYTQQAAAKYPYGVPATRNYNVWAEPSYRPFLRKAGSDFGWDWGPAFVTSGIAGDAYIEWLSTEETSEDTGGTSVELQDINVSYELLFQTDFSIAHGHVSVDIKSVPAVGNVILQLVIDGEVHGPPVVVLLAASPPSEDGNLLLSTTEAELPFAIKNPTLWWPVGYGDAHLYNIRLDAYTTHRSQPLTTLSHRIGFRTVELVQQPTDAGGVHGATFFFLINSVPIFIKGANWIPNDSFPTRVKTDKVEFLLASAVAANMNMLRVWGGGRYESDAFYATCDRLGLLVWHEFMFACGMYPRDMAFVDDVAREVHYQTKRLRKFTSVAIWGGNNENENMMASFAQGEFLPPHEYFNRDVFVVDFTALFVDVVRPLVLSLDTSRPFVDTSPSNGLLSTEPYVKRWGVDTNDVAYGDVHYYNYTDDCQDPGMYPHARFISEFGFQSMPSFYGMREISDPEDWRSLQNFWKLLKFRERHANGTQQMAHQIRKRFHVPFPFLDEPWLETPLSVDVAIDVQARVASYLYLTQIQQALCYQTAIETWRRGRNAALGGTMGILYWQLNDVWQGTSWSSIEFNGRWKSLQYVVQRAFASVLLAVYQDTLDVVVHGVNDLKDRDLEVDLVYELVDTESGRVVHTATTATKTLSRLSSEPLDRVSVASLFDAVSACDACSCFLRVKCGGSTKCDDAFLFLSPFKQLHLRHGLVHIDHVALMQDESVDAFEVTLRCEGFVALFVELEAVEMSGYWSQNTFHLVGNETRTLRFMAATSSTQRPHSVDAFVDQLELRWLQQTYESDAAMTMD